MGGNRDLTATPPPYSLITPSVVPKSRRAEASRWLKEKYGKRVQFFGLEVRTDVEVSEEDAQAFIERFTVRI